MAKIEVCTGNIEQSKHSGVIKNTCLPGGEDDLKVYESLDTLFIAEGPVWNEDNKEKNVQLSDCYRQILKMAEDQGVEELDLPCIPAAECRSSELFQAATQGLRAVKAHMDENELPKVVRFIASRDEIANMYKMAYNYWVADDHDTKMDVPHHHDD